MRKFIYLLLLVIVASSCSTSKLKQQVKAHNYFNKYPNELAELCGTKFPAETKYLPGKPITVPGKPVIIPGDTVTVYVDCPDGSKQKADCPPVDTVMRTDTLRIVDTVQVQNTALITSLNYTIANQQARIDIQDQQIKEQAAEIKKQGRQIAGGTIGIIVGIIIFAYLLLRRK